MDDYQKNYLRKMSGDEVYQEFVKSCASGDLEKLIFIVNELSEERWNANWGGEFFLDGQEINLAKGLAFISACKNGNDKIVEYLINSPEVYKLKNIDPRVENDLGFYLSCKKGYLSTVKILVQIESFKKDGNFKQVIEKGMLLAKVNKHDKTEEFLRKLILDNDLTHITVKKKI